MTRSGATTSPWRTADVWLLAPVPPERLAVLRILTGTFALVYVLVRLPVLADLVGRDGGFEPVGLAVLLDRPLPEAVGWLVLVVTLAAGAGYLTGTWFRVTGPAFALSLLAIGTYRSSWGQLLHFENLLVLQVLVVAFARSADALSVDARRAAARRGDSRRARALDPGAYGWPVRLAALITVATYVLAGVAKLRIGGLDWMLGDTLRNHVAYSAARLDVLGGTPSPLARLLIGQGWLFPPFAIATVLVELGVPIALLGGRLRDAWVAAVWLLHLGVAALMLVVFPYPLFLVAFAPFYDLERLAGVRGWRRGAHSRPGPVPA